METMLDSYNYCQWIKRHSRSAESYSITIEYNTILKDKQNKDNKMHNSSTKVSLKDMLNQTKRPDL